MKIDHTTLDQILSVVENAPRNSDCPARSFEGPRIVRTLKASSRGVRLSFFVLFNVLGNKTAFLPLMVGRRTDPEDTLVSLTRSESDRRRYYPSGIYPPALQLAQVHPRRGSLCVPRSRLPASSLSSSPWSSLEPDTTRGRCSRHGAPF